MKKINTIGLGLLLAAFLLVSCDMAYITQGGKMMKPSSGSESGNGNGGKTPEQIADENADAIAELEKNGHYLQIYHLPSGVRPDNFSTVSILDSAQVARTDTSSEILIAPDSVYANAYIPLVAQNGSVFNRTGAFFVSFTVQIDARTKISILPAHQVLVEFAEGRGTLDLEKLIANPPNIPGVPGIVEAVPDPEQSAIDNNIDGIIASGGYIRFWNLPRNVSKNSFTKVMVLNNSTSVANVSDYDAITVRKGLFTAEAYVPLNSPRGNVAFSETGAFSSAFSIIIDSLTKIIVEAKYASLYVFEDGHTDIDVTTAPVPPAAIPRIPHTLVVAGLPNTVSAPNIIDVFVYNSQGVVAKCPDYTQITFRPHDGKTIAIIPLVYDNNKAFNGLEFAASGDYIVSFTIFPDARQVIQVTQENNCILTFSNGSASIDIKEVPSIPRNCLTITNLPPNLQHLNITDVYILNQSGKIAFCADYSLLEIISSGTKSTVRIPLFYKDSGLIFTETGPYYVTFDMNVDALTRILMVENDKLIVNFYGGQGELDAVNLPQALPPPYLTIMGLPPNTAKGNFVDVFLYNAVGKIAKCADYSQIIISKNATTASAMIPLVYNENAKEYFRDSGTFVATFTINVDINTQIIKTRADAWALAFTNGSGEGNLVDDFGYFSGELRNPNDISPPIIKSGTIFEMNGSYEKLTADTPVKAATFPRTCVVYIYAVKKLGAVTFEYSTIEPVYSSTKGGFYSGERRALYKLLYIQDTVTQYVAKTFITDPFRAFDHYSVDSVSMSNIHADNMVYTLGGSANLGAQNPSFNEGWYLVTLTGAGGGGGGGIDGAKDRDRYGGTGGAGGYITELVYFPGGQLTVFTGSGGSGSGAIGYGQYQGCGAGGGGSGTFIYSADGYLLCAGGGGGGGGGGANDGGGAGGGAGGSVGSGGGGGKGGDDGGYGGSVGGKGGGAGGGVANSGSAVYAVIASGQGFAGSGSGGDDGGANGGWGGSAFYTAFEAPDTWKNTNNANGTGGYGQTYGHGGGGGTGGNNRNGARGNGAAGGAAGVPSDSPASAGIAGAPGSVKILKVD